MSANITLEHILEEILEVLKPKQEDLATRAQVIKELRRVVESVPSLRGAEVEPYGSFVSNLFTKWGDVDISINLLKGGDVENNCKIKLLEDLQKPLRDRWQMVQLIHARVPILKCKSSHHIFSCDISIDNLIGRMKSKLLLCISEIDWRFRDMVLLVKEWAKAHEINDATSKSGTFNSYSLTLLVIFHFQTCEPPIFPPLEDIADVLQERNIAEACAANIRRFRQDKFRQINHSSLSELFISFLAKFSDKEFKASKLGICTYTGKCECRRRNIRWSHNTDAILIEDPFERTENSARAVSMSGSRMISEAFEKSRVISADQNLDSLLATLVGPQVSPKIRAHHNQGQHSGDTGKSSVLVGGLLLGGLAAAGTLGYMYAPELSRAAGDLRRKFFDDSYGDSDNCEPAILPPLKDIYEGNVADDLQEIKMCANNTLEHILEEILEVLKPKQEDLATRAQVINELQRVVESVQSLRDISWWEWKDSILYAQAGAFGAAVEPFGSFVSNLFTKWGDLDISINLAMGGYISYVESDRKQKLLKDLQNPLTGQWPSVQFISAKVPILKCESSHRIFSCDISIDNLKGQMKSKLFLWISEIDGRFRDMILLVKEWAKAREINDPNSGTLNSYSLSLLVIFHFQTCEPAIFPPLKDIYAGNVADDLQGLRIVAERNIAEACAAKIRRFKQDKFRRVNHSSLSELFILFLAKFSDIGFKASELGICTYTGKWECRRSNIRWSRKTNAILIEDPFEQQENSARAVNMSGLTRISEAFEKSRVVSADQNQDSLLVTLVRSQVSQEIRARLRNIVSYGGGYRPHPTHPHVHRNVNLQSETENQFRNLRLKSNSNNPTLTETGNMYGKFEASESKTQNQFKNLMLESRSYNPSMTEIAQGQSQGQHSGDAEKSSLSVGGLLLGGLVAGLGYMYAPELSKAADDLKRRFFDDSDDD